MSRICEDPHGKHTRGWATWSRSVSRMAMPRRCPWHAGQRPCSQIPYFSPDDIIGSHHLIFFVLEDVAVKHIRELLTRAHWRAGWKVKLSDDANDLSRQTLYRILECRPLVGWWLLRRPGIDEFLGVLVHVEGTPVENLELHDMDMNRMGITGGVDEAPYFYGPGLGILGYRVV